jgi:hypothetical protein
MHKSATKCNDTIGKWCKNKHGASKIIDTFETYQDPKHNRRTTAREREENRTRSISVHPSDGEEHFVQEIPEAALVAA